jgi:hypothetical protein
MNNEWHHIVRCLHGIIIVMRPYPSLVGRRQIDLSPSPLITRVTDKFHYVIVTINTRAQDPIFW